MFGRGVISLQYGWALEEAGHTVHFYVRPGKKELYGSQVHLDLLDARFDAKQMRVVKIVDITLIEYIPADHDYELIILSVQHYSFGQAATELLSKINGAIVLVFSNFWQDPQQLTQDFPAKKLVWGFPQAGGGWTEEHTLTGSILKDVHFGTFCTEMSEADLIIRAVFKEAKFKIIEHRDFKGWLYIHFIINAGLFSRVGGTRNVIQVLTNNQEAKKAILNIRWGLKLVEARGIVLRRNLSDYLLFLLPVSIGAWLLKLMIKLNPPIARILSAHSNPQESKSYPSAVIKTAKELGVDTLGWNQSP